MTPYTKPWITGGSHCEVHWLFEENKWDPKPFLEGCQYPGTFTRLEYTGKKFAQSGRLPSEKGHWRKGPSPQNKLYEFKDGPSGVRLLAFSYNPTPGICWFIVAIGAVKDRDDIRQEEVDRALQRRQRFLDKQQQTSGVEQSSKASAPNRKKGGRR